MADERLPTIAVLGASGLIGEASATQLSAEGFPVIAIARGFSRSQKAEFGEGAVESPVVLLGAPPLSTLLAGAEIVVNCIGVLQDAPAAKTDTVHRVFVENLVAALKSCSERKLLIHLSIPGRNDEDVTDFSTTKRAAEHAIADASIPFVIIRPGFVITAQAYGGSALMRAIAAVPFDLPAREAMCPFATTDLDDIVRTISFVARRWSAGERRWSAVWDVMSSGSTTLGDAIRAFRRHFGGPRTLMALPAWLMAVGSSAGDLVARAGWSPPMRSTSLRELRRGVVGDPGPWIAATGIRPASLERTVGRLSSTIQERWFARLYLAKGLVVASAALFWILSGLIAATVAFEPATAFVMRAGLPRALAGPATLITSVVDIAIGLAIAIRSSCRLGLVLGIGVTAVYLIAASVMAPSLWLDPLGPLLKAVPIAILMIVALAILENR